MVLKLVTELCTGGELFDRIIEKTQESHDSGEFCFSEKDATILMKKILSAVEYCHVEKGIVHRDLKPENFLFKDESEHAEIKIIDFGLSRHDDENSGIMNTKVGTPYYVAPEVLSRCYTKACDMWSVGVISYILLCGYAKFIQKVFKLFTQFELTPFVGIHHFMVIQIVKFFCK